MNGVYPPLTEWIERLRHDIEMHKTLLFTLENRLRLCEELAREVLRQKEGHNEH